MNRVTLTPGQLTTRDENQKRYGGGSQEGIVPSKTSPFILIYVDHHSGAKYGYEDGWLAEEDDLGPIFEYTGRGAIGHQTFFGQAGSRNKAILRHVDERRSLLLFMAEGRVPGSKSAAKQQRFLGQFELDKGQPYIIREGSDEQGDRRRIIVFRMRPMGAFQHSPKDTITRASQTEILKVSSQVTAAALAEPEEGKTGTSRRSAQPSTRTEHRKNELTQRYRNFLEQRGCRLFAYQIKPAGTSSTLKTDLYDETNHVLYSLRGSCSREDIRMAVGQLKDYRRHIEPKNPRLAVALPNMPCDDLQDFLQAENILLVYQAGEDFAGDVTTLISRA